MRKFTLLTAIMASTAAFAPFGASAASGTAIYQPGPIIVHATAAKQTRQVTQGRTAYRKQINAIRSERAAG
ncbi:hypothetical protein [Acidiphilium sp.]|uniref:hypothetical protein n=1 Tax=Acidiphilium sp. TaxID=527 RepID=UPI003D002ECE